MKLTISLLLVCVSVMVCVAVPVDPWGGQQREQSAYSAGQATGKDAAALSEAYEDFLGRLALAYATASNGSAVATSRLDAKEVTPVEEENIEENPQITPKSI